jgi:hypothetical protein
MALQMAAHRLRRWLPALTVLWALAATVAVLQPCRDAFAASLPHPHGPQMASAAHAHAHGPAAGAHHPAGDACQCAELAPPFTATALDEGTLSGPERTAPGLSPAVDGWRLGPAAIAALTRPAIARKPPRYLTTCRLRI